MSAAPSPEHLAALAAARHASVKIRRVILIGTIDGWSTVILGGLTFFGSILTSSIPGDLLGVAMIGLGWRQLQTAAALRKLSIDAPRTMAINQLLLCAAVCLYAGWSLFSSMNSPSELDAAMKEEPALGQMVGSMTGLESTINITIYTGVIVGSILIMGGTAWYYGKKTVLVQLYVAQTPQWIVQMQQTSDPL